jgi:Domain of unknown function (DUF4160)
VKTFKIRRTEEEEESFDVTILPPRNTGLPFVVYISQNTGVVPYVRIEIVRKPRMSRSDTVKVAIIPTTRLMAGYLSSQELALVTRWVDLNRDTLIKYWDGEIAYTEDVFPVLKAVPASSGSAVN